MKWTLKRHKWKTRNNLRENVAPWQWIYVCNYLLIIYLPNQTKKAKQINGYSKKRRAVDDDLLKSDKWWWNENFTAKFANSRENE